MKNRFSKFFLHLFIKYIPSANQIAEQEAKRLAEYVHKNFTDKESVLILDKMKECIVEFMEEEISEKKNDIDVKILELEKLKKTLSKIQT